MWWIKIDTPGIFWYEQKLEKIKYDLQKHRIDTSGIDKQLAICKEPFDFVFRK
jgi:hypothetical protein